MSKMIADDPILRKRLDDAAQRARDQELKIIILEKEIEQLKACNMAKSTEDPSPNEKEIWEDRMKDKDLYSKPSAPSKAGQRDDIGQRPKESKNQAADTKHDSKQSHSTGGEGRSSDRTIPQLARRTK